VVGLCEHGDESLSYMITGNFLTILMTIILSSKALWCGVS